jgi:hypothetical protein
MRNTLLVLMGVLLLVAAVEAKDSGPMIVNNILWGSASGGAIGLSAGFLAYADTNNTKEDLLWMGAVYGIISGALFGTGASIYEISANQTNLGSTVSMYMLGGTGMGAVLGLLVARIPYQDNPDNRYFSRGLGWGGILGASLGLGIAFLDLGTQSPRRDYLLSRAINEHPDAQPLLLPVFNSGAEAPIFTCRLLKVVF